MLFVRGEIAGPSLSG